MQTKEVIYNTSGSAARHPSLYLALRARAWLRMSQSYDLSDSVLEGA